MSRFPADLAVLLGCSYMVLPIALLGGWVGIALYNARRTGDMTLVWIGAAFGLIGVILLFFARLPLYRQRRFLTFGPKELDPTHRRLYFWAYRFIIVSVALLAVLLIFLTI